MNVPASIGPLRVAVVGHTNTGKTSLMRTLMRDVTFGEISDRPGTTRHVEGATLTVGGRPLIELYDTPGLEDSIALLETLDARRTDRREPWIETIQAFLQSAEAHARFEQEAKALRQVLASDAALYVIDARDRVLGKHRDELEILARCARPVVPVLNFVASPEARTAAWREALQKLNLHAVAEFDTVVVDTSGERRLFEKMLTLLDGFRPILETLIAERATQHASLVRAAGELLADLLIDVAAYTVVVPEHVDQQAAISALKDAVRRREQACVDALLALFRFRAGDWEENDLPLVQGAWGLDLFHPASLKEFGIRASSGAAAGGLAGLAIDAMTGGLSLGAAAALGAAVGALWGTFQSHGRRIIDVFRGYTELRVNDDTLRLLAVRQIDLVQALLRRGHAAQEKIRLAEAASERRQAWVSATLPEPLSESRLHPEWSRLGGRDALLVESDAARLAARDRLAAIIAQALIA